MDIFNGLRSVAVPVTDQSRTARILGALGFTVAFDTELQPGFRWVELALPGASTAIALVTAGDQLPAGIDTGIRLTTADARAARDAVIAQGLEAGDLLDWKTAPLMFSFVDPDGNRFYVSEVG